MAQTANLCDKWVSASGDRLFQMSRGAPGMQRWPGLAAPGRGTERNVHHAGSPGRFEQLPSRVENLDSFGGVVSIVSQPRFECPHVDFELMPVWV